VELAAERHGAGGPVLVLLHGAGANGAVWAPVIERLRATWPGSIIVPDLRGHGRSPRAAAYGLGLHAADVAELLAPVEEIYVGGHSMGGAIALILASGWFGVSVCGTLAFSMKTAFDAAELEKARTFAQTPPRRFGTRDEALERYLRVAGLSGLVPVESVTAQAGAVERDGAWELAADPATVLAGGPDIGPMFDAARGRLIVATGELDPIAPAADLLPYAPQLRVIAGAAHNVQVENPAAIAALIAELTA
jgi:pimeloyl-ACP methyl ester carboxylesterase